MLLFTAKLQLIGINPYVLLPARVLTQIFKQAGKDKSPIPVEGAVNGKPYTQNLVKYDGDWRLYINTTMLKNSPKRIGEKMTISIQFDPEDRIIPMHPALRMALDQHQQAKEVFDKLSPSRQKEIVRYISFLKTEVSVTNNVTKAIQFLLGKQRFIGQSLK